MSESTCSGQDRCQLILGEIKPWIIQPTAQSLYYAILALYCSPPWNRPQRPRGGVEVQLYSFLNLGTRCGWVVNVTPRPLYPRERPGAHYIGGWVGPRAGPDRCGKSRPHLDSIPGPSSPQRVTIPTELSQSTLSTIHTMKLLYCLFKVMNCGTLPLQPRAVNGWNMEKQYAKLSLWSSRMQPHVQCSCNMRLEDSISETPQKCW